MGRRPTLEDVAARAGVSRGLASIVMRDAPGARETTRVRVLAAAAEIGYRPDTRARLLASGDSRQLGVVFEIAGHFHAELLDGLYVAAGEAGCELILSALTPSRDARSAIETLLDFRCGAAILLAPASTDVPTIADRLPLTVIGWHVADPSVAVVRTSDDEGVRRLVEHLVALGHRDILHVDGGPGPIATARRGAYSSEMRRHDLADHIRIVRGGDNLEAGVRVARPLLSAAPRPTAVIAYNDDVAAGLVEALVHAGVRVPQDLSIVGFDDSPLGRLPHLNLTTVRQDPRELARLAVARSAARSHGAPVSEREVVLAPELVVRGSSAAV